MTSDWESTYQGADMGITSTETNDNWENPDPEDPGPFGVTRGQWMSQASATPSSTTEDLRDLSRHVSTLVAENAGTIPPERETVNTLLSAIEVLDEDFKRLWAQFKTEVPETDPRLWTVWDELGDVPTQLQELKARAEEAQQVLWFTEREEACAIADQVALRADS